MICVAKWWVSRTIQPWEPTKLFPAPVGPIMLWQCCTGQRDSRSELSRHRGHVDWLDEVKGHDEGQILFGNSDWGWLVQKKLEWHKLLACDNKHSFTSSQRLHLRKTLDQSWPSQSKLGHSTMGQGLTWSDLGHDNTALWKQSTWLIMQGNDMYRTIKGQWCHLP